MAVTLNLKPETQAGVRILADEQGVSVEDYLVGIVEGTMPARSKAVPPEQRAALWLESAKRFPNTPPLTDEAISRESMYADRG